LVCECFKKTKDQYKYFSVGHNGRCHGGKNFNGDRQTADNCIYTNDMAHSGGQQGTEYVYQIKADAATRTYLRVMPQPVSAML